MYPAPPRIPHRRPQRPAPARYRVRIQPGQRHLTQRHLARHDHKATNMPAARDWRI